MFNRRRNLKGIYVLIIRLNQAVIAEIGALGKLSFDEGLYAYVGSAQNRLEHRVARHKRREKRLFWHIDYLLSNPAAQVTDVFFGKGRKSEECKTAQMLAKKALAIAGFGCSDCRCVSHLFYTKNFDFLLSEAEFSNFAF